MNALSEEQLRDRINYLGASDISIILGLSPYKTAFQLYLEKSGLIHPESAQTERTLWGSLLESVIREQYAARNDVVVETPEQITHKNYPFIKANLDGFIPSLNAILEIKTGSAFTASQWGEPGSNEIPVHYLVQVAMYCAIADVERAHIAVLLDGADYREYKYERDLAIEEALMRECLKFWDCVQQEIPPKPITIEDLKFKYWQPQEGALKEASLEVIEHLEGLKSVREQLKELADREEQHKFEVMSFLEEAELLVDDEGEILATWKKGKRGRVLIVK